MRVGRLLGVGMALLGLGSISVPAYAVVPFEDTPIRGWGVNGPVLATAIVGNTVVVGGSFTRAVSPQGVSVDRVNLAAFSLSTGALLTGWRADTNGTVNALSDNGTSIWVGGSFTSVRGVPRARLAKLNAGTAAVDTGFSASVNGLVRAVEVAGDDLYIGGGFSAVNGVSRGRIAKLDADTGGVDPQFAARADKAVYSLAISSTGRLFVSGVFTLLSGALRLGVGGVSAVTGQVSGPAFEATSVPIYGLDVSPDGSVVFGAQQSNQLTAWNASTGLRRWRVVTDGNAQAVKYYAGTVYFGFHDGYQGNTSLKLLAVNPTTGAVDPSFRPAINSFYGVFAIDAFSGGLAVGGYFTTVAGTTTRRIALFT